MIEWLRRYRCIVHQGFNGRFGGRKPVLMKKIGFTAFLRGFGAKKAGFDEKNWIYGFLERIRSEKSRF